MKSDIFINICKIYLIFRKVLFSMELVIEIVEDVEEYNKPTQPQNVKKTTNVLTRFEYVMLIAARALQISAGSEPLIPYQEEGLYNPRDIAERELLERVIPLLIQRTLPDGSKEFWHVKDMFIKNY
jgi:DNA-directed RNA polymerase subunit K/omega